MGAYSHGGERGGVSGLVFRVDKQLERRQWFLRISEPLGLKLAGTCLLVSFAGHVLVKEAGSTSPSLVWPPTM